MVISDWSPGCIVVSSAEESLSAKGVDVQSLRVLGRINLIEVLPAEVL